MPGPFNFFSEPIYFVAEKFGRHPECFGQVYGLQAIIQESYSNAYLLMPTNIGAKYFAKAKACGRPNLSG